MWVKIIRLKISNTPKLTAQEQNKITSVYYKTKQKPLTEIYEYWEKNGEKVEHIH